MGIGLPIILVIIDIYEGLIIGGLVIGMLISFFIITFFSILYTKYNEKIKIATEKYVTEPATKSASISKQNMQNLDDIEAQNSFSQANDVSTNKVTSTINTNINTCKSCGQQLSSDAVFCSNCGTRRD